MRRVVMRFCACIVFVLPTALVFFSMVGAEERPSVEIEQVGNGEIQQAVEIEGKEAKEKKRSVESEHEEMLPQEKGEEEEPAEGSPILSRWPVEKITLGTSTLTTTTMRSRMSLTRTAAAVLTWV